MIPRPPDPDRASDTILAEDDPLVGYVRDGQASLFYKSGAWQRKRLEIIERDNHECQRCKQFGHVGKGEMVHHIKHLKSEPRLGLSASNLVTLCRRCHEAVHADDLSGNYARRNKILSDERW